MFWLLLALIAAALLAWWRPGGRVAAAVYGLALLLFGLFGGMPLLFALLAALWLAALLLFGLAPLRQEWLARPLLARFRRALARLDAGLLAQLLAPSGSGWEAELLSGRPDWSGFLSAAKTSPSTKSDPLPAPGGAAADDGIEANAETSPSVLAWIELLRRHGTPAQQRRWLAPLLRGECRLAGSPQALAGDGEVIALEDETGTRPALRLRLDAPLAATADLYGLRVWLQDPRRLIGGRGGPSAVLLPADTPGLRVEAGVLGAAELCVDFEAVIGGIESIGLGHTHWNEAQALAMATLVPRRHEEFARRIQTVAAARARIHAPLSVATGTQPAAQQALALLAARAGAAQAMAALAAHLLSRGEPPQAVAAFAASLAAEQRAQLVAAAAALGVRAGTAHADDEAETPPCLARAERYTVVVLRGHRAFVRALAAAHETNAAQALERFDAALREHLGHLAHTAVRALAFGLSRSVFFVSPGGDAAQRAAIRRIDRASAALAFAADLALGRLALDLASRRPRTAARARRAAARLSLTTGLGDATAQLWLASAALKRHVDRGAPAEERALLTRICDDACRAAEDALDGVLRELASPWLARVARWLVFPLGRGPRQPDAATDRRLAQASLEAERLRAQLRAAGPRCAALAQALEATLAGEALEARLVAHNTAPRLSIADALAARRIDAAGAQQLERWLAAVRAVQGSALPD